MELYKNTTNSLLNYLKHHGYPDKNIAIEWGDGQFAIDLAILADDLITPIAIFEIKIRKSSQSILTGVYQLRKAIQHFDISVPCYLVFGENNDVGFEVFDVSDSVLNNEEIDIPNMMGQHPSTELISYDNIQVGFSSKAISKAARKKQAKIDRIKPICWILFPSLAAILLLLDALNIYQITTLRLLVYGAIVIIVLIPFFSEISLKDITFKRKGGN